MKNTVMDELLSLKQQELDMLRNVGEKYAPNSLYLYEKMGDFQRPEFEMKSDFFVYRSKLIKPDFCRVKFLIDEPLSSEMKNLFESGNGMISDVARSYQHFKREGGSSSFDLIGHFFPEEYSVRTVQEVLCTAGYLIDQYISEDSVVVSNLLADNQENLDLGIIILKKPMVKGLYEPKIAYNVHLEFKVGANGKVEEIHIHLFEVPRSFKTNRHGLI